MKPREVCNGNSFIAGSSVKSVQNDDDKQMLSLSETLYRHEFESPGERK